MSIQSEISRINSEVSDQESLINQIKTALEGKAAGGGGGGSVETCTVTVNSFAANINRVRYSSFENGKVKWNEINYSPLITSATITNVLSGSFVRVDTNYNYCYFTYSGNYPDDFIEVYQSGSYSEFVPFTDTTVTIIDDD